jgi:hypothetical protein
VSYAALVVDELRLMFRFISPTKGGKRLDPYELIFRLGVFYLRTEDGNKEYGTLPQQAANLGKVSLGDKALQKN